MSDPTAKPPIMEALFNWIFVESDVVNRMEQFALNYCDQFEYIADESLFRDAENHISYTMLYEQYQALFDEELNQFVAAHGWTYEDFLQACHDADAQEERNSIGLHHWLKSMAEYEEFKLLMLQTKKSKVDRLMSEQQQQQQQYYQQQNDPNYGQDMNNAMQQQQYGYQ